VKSSSGLDERERRIAANEAIFREVNERIRDVADTLQLEDESEFVCECGDLACTERIRVARTDYEVTRREPRRFLTRHGHVAQDVEFVVEQRDGYEVVQKREGEPARVAEQTDPAS
jgi:AraC-like DNA-binding protein